MYILIFIAFVSAVLNINKPVQELFTFLLQMFNVQDGRTLT